MKKLFFSLMAAACALTANAQELAAGDYYLRNVESGKYVAWGANWGTRSVLTEHGALLRVTLADGQYTLGTQATANYTKAIRPSDGFADQSGTWTLEDAGNGQYRIKGSSGYYRYDGTGLPVVNGTDSQSGLLWEFLTKDQLTAKMSEASATNPVDATHFIKSPDFLTNDNNITAQNAWGVNIKYNSGQPTFKGEVGSGNTLVNNTNLEIWNNTSVNLIKQELTGLPKGTYKLSFYGLYRDGAPADAATKRTAGTEELKGVVYAGDVQLPVMSIFEYAGAHGLAGSSTSLGNVPNSNGQAAQHFAQGDYLNTLYFQVAEDNGSVVIGVNKETKTDNDWFVVDNFDLKYYGEASVEEIENASIILEWEAFKPAYDDKAALLDAAGQASYASATAAITTPTSVEALELAKAGVQAAYIAAVKAQTTMGANFTDAIVNPNFDGNIQGWIDSFTGSLNHGYQNNNTYGTINQFMECWAGQWSGATAPYLLPNGKLSQVIANLPAGTYTLTADAIATQQQAGQDGYIANLSEATGIYLFAGDTRSVALNVTGDASSHAVSMYFTIPETQDVEIGLVIENTNCNWAVLDNVKLFKGARVDMAVNADAKWSTFCAPFEVAIPQGAKAYTVDGVVDDILTLTEVSAIAANTPVVLNAEAGVPSTTSWGDIQNGSTTYGLLTGVYETTAITSGYVLQNQTEKGIGFYAVDGVKNVPANKAYLTAPAAGVKAFFFGEATAIEAIEALTAGKAQIFDMNGRQINKLQKGINIVNGKKIMVK